MPLRTSDLVYFYAANLSAEAEADLEGRVRLYFERLRVKLDVKNEQGYAAADPKIAVIAWHANRFCPRCHIVVTVASCTTYRRIPLQTRCMCSGVEFLTQSEIVGSRAR